MQLHKGIVEAAVMKCEFCGCVKDSMLTCPRCNVHYCSLNCYRHKNHLQCSESFYRENVEEDLKSRGEEKFGAKDANPIIEKLKQMQAEDEKEGEETTFDDFEKDTEDEIPPEFHPEYLNYGITDIEKMSEAELDAELAKMGIATDTESLLRTLNDDEREYLQELVDEHGIEVDKCSFLLLLKRFSYGKHTGNVARPGRGVKW